MQFAFLSAIVAFAAAAAALPTNAVLPRAGAPTPAVPARFLPPPSRAANWETVGCARDQYPARRVLNGGFFSSASMTIGKCLDYCGTQRQAYAGLENGNECFCGPQLDHNAEVTNLVYNERACTIAAAGNPAQNAGGSNALLLFKHKVDYPAPPSRNPSPIEVHDGHGKFEYVGCFKDFADARVLKVLVGTSPARTNAGCVKTCAQRGYQYASTQNGNECRCANKLPKLTHVNTCTKPCTGNKDETCGGANYAQSLYQAIGAPKV